MVKFTENTRNLHTLCWGSLPCSGLIIDGKMVTQFMKAVAVNMSSHDRVVSLGASIINLGPAVDEMGFLVGNDFLHVIKILIWIRANRRFRIDQMKAK